MELGMDKEVQLLQQKREEALASLRSVEIDMEIAEKNPYVTDQEKHALRRIIAGIRYRYEELDKRVTAIERAMHGETNDTKERESK